MRVAPGEECKECKFKSKVAKVVNTILLMLSVWSMLTEAWLEVVICVVLGRFVDCFGCSVQPITTLARFGKLSLRGEQFALSQDSSRLKTEN